MSGLLTEYILFYLLILFGSMVFLSSRAKKYSENNYKLILSFSVNGWTIFYGVVAPLLLIVFDPAFLSTSPNYYIAATFLLFVSALIFDILLRGLHVKTLNIKPSFYWFYPPISLLSILAIWVGILPASGELIIYSAVVIPMLTMMYAKQNGFLKFFAAAFVHGTFLYLSYQSGFLQDSKERIFVIALFPLLLARLIRVGRIRYSEISVAALLVMIAFVAWSPIVSANRMGYELNASDISLAWSNYEVLLENNLRRMGVIDALAIAVENEFGTNPDRPSVRLWTITGPFFQLFPAIFERPNHAREALFFVGYETSHTDVNIALTYAGHILWSFGLVPFLLAIYVFWQWLFIPSRLLSRLHSDVQLIFLVGAIVAFVRLESLSNVVAGQLLYSLVVAVTISLTIYFKNDRRVFAWRKPRIGFRGSA